MAACRRAQLRGWPNAAGTGMQVAPLRMVVVLHRGWPYGRQPGPPAAGVRRGASASPSLRADSRSACPGWAPFSQVESGWPVWPIHPSGLARRSDPERYLPNVDLPVNQRPCPSTVVLQHQARPLNVT